MPLHPIENLLDGKQNYSKCLFLHNYAFTQRFDSYSIKPWLLFSESFTFLFISLLTPPNRIGEVQLSYLLPGTVHVFSMGFKSGL